MSETETSGGAKIFRGLLFAVVIVGAIVLLAVFWRQVLNSGKSLGEVITDGFPSQSGQRVAVVVFLILAVLLGIGFSHAGHYTAYGLAVGLGPLLWFLFWEGFPPLGLKTSWAESAGLPHLDPWTVILWAIVADVVITLVFVPLEFREKYLRRKHALDAD
ncbi:hypothetical protein HDA40_001083 [Hamadaea flava]|uniref:Uncharacterized protein n=1 Tax=Hamadaea flava TaxID=1742688 RepID=A0ABV8LR35_9ACTN|nr:hypothetical protein [Hamadaea flava]MCP2322576.1 hypothetical protein [Hamadaea flava]